MDELEESATNAEVSAEAMLIAAGAVLTETREPIEALRISSRRWQEQLSGKLKEHGFIQSERDPCLFVAVGPSELTKNLLQELSKKKKRQCVGVW